jgi:hypothetical protein
MEGSIGVLLWDSLHGGDTTQSSIPLFGVVDRVFVDVVWDTDRDDFLFAVSLFDLQFGA